MSWHDYFLTTISIYRTIFAIRNTIFILFLVFFLRLIQVQYMNDIKFNKRISSFFQVCIYLCNSLRQNCKVVVNCAIIRKKKVLFWDNARHFLFHKETDVNNYLACIQRKFGKCSENIVQSHIADTNYHFCFYRCLLRKDRCHEQFYHYVQ